MEVSKTLVPDAPDTQKSIQALSVQSNLYILFITAADGGV